MSILYKLLSSLPSSWRPVRAPEPVSVPRTSSPNYEEIAERIINIVKTTTINVQPSRGRGVPSDSRRRLRRKIRRAVVRELRRLDNR